MSRAVSNSSIEDFVRAIKDRYAVMLDSDLLGVAISDCYEHMYAVNDRLLAMLGYSRADFERGLVSWSSITPPRYDSADETKLRELYETSVAGTHEKEYLKKNGRSVPVVVAAEMLSYDPPINLSLVLDMSLQHQEGAARTRATVLATVGHELKTPMSVLRIQGELLSRQVRQLAVPRKVLAELRAFDEQIAHIDHMLTDVLTLNADQEAYDTPMTEFDVVLSLKRVIADISLLTDRKIILGKIDPNCFIRGSKSEIRELFTNLISNALKFSGQDTAVTVSAWREGNEICTEVRDWGVGIAKADQKNIFETSYQIRQPNTSHAPTSRGIGLHICKQIMKRHHGRLSVTSEPGQGSSFFCIFKAL